MIMDNGNGEGGETGRSTGKEQLPESSAPADEISDIDEGSLVQITTTLSWNAPLPPPAQLKQYDEILPGFAKELVDQLSAQAKFVQERQKEAQDASIKHYHLGQWMGFFAVLGVLGISALALMQGEGLVASIGITMVAGVGSAFVWITRREKDGKPPDQ